MNSKIRIAGAQIPCSADILTNLNTIKKAIDWASDNNVDYLVTPEASLSGYNDTIDSVKLKDALKEIEDYIKEKQVGLCLGTLWGELEEKEIVRRNQIRFYNSQGILLGAINKTILCPLDHELQIESNPIFVPIFLTTYKTDYYIPTAGFICNDLYGKKYEVSVTDHYADLDFKLYIHSTNAERNVSEVHDRVFYDYNNANIQLASYLKSDRYLLTVDNCIGMRGEDYKGQTSSPSGILKAGEWLVQAPNTDINLFYYDFEFKDIAVHKDDIK